MHEKTSWEIPPKIPIASLFKVIFSTFFERLKNLVFEGGIPTFKNETRKRLGLL